MSAQRQFATSHRFKPETSALVPIDCQLGTLRSHGTMGRGGSRMAPAFDTFTVWCLWAANIQKTTGRVMALTVEF